VVEIFVPGCRFRSVSQVRPVFISFHRGDPVRRPVRRLALLAMLRIGMCIRAVQDLVIIFKDGVLIPGVIR
jgi:hypothetical protein